MQDMLRSVFVCEKVSSDFGKCLRSHNCLWRSKAPQQPTSAICIGQVDDGLSTLVTSAKAGASCSEYMQKLREHGKLPSMSRPSNPYDNAVCESFLKTLKSEEIHPSTYWDFEDLRERMEEFIEGYYNVCRLHSALDYRSPVDFEKESQRESQKTSAAAMMTFFEG